MYLINIFRRRYSNNPYSGDASVYPMIALRASDTPFLPRPSSSTASLDVYFNRNLYGPQPLPCDCHACLLETHQPPASATAVWYAFWTSGLSRPLRDMAFAQAGESVRQRSTGLGRPLVAGD